MEILIVKLSAIGDVVHTLPALNAIRRHYPDARITWLIEEAAAPLVVGHEALDRVIVSRRKTWMKRIASSPGAVLAEVRGFLRQLRDTEYDVILDFQGLLKSGILVALARGRRKIGFGRGMQHQECSYIFLNEPVPAVDMEIHALVRYLKMLEPLGISENEEISYNIPVSESDRQWASRVLEDAGRGKGTGVAALNPAAKWETKLWLPERFAALADAITDRYGMPVLFTGGSEDRSDIDKITSLMKNSAVNLAGKTSLTRLAALYEGVAVVVTTDTGPMHIAAAVNAPVVALFGPTAPWRTGPFGNNNRVLRGMPDCSPCFKRSCDTVECMAQIGVDDVLGAVEELCPGII